jgi:hypothetical protein
MKERKVKVKMLGNHAKYENGKEYEVDEREAAFLTGYGFAVKVDVENAPKEAEE